VGYGVLHPNNVNLIHRARVSVSVIIFNLSVLFDSVWCRNCKLINTIFAITDGIRRCNAKNHVSVALCTANSAHVH